MDTVRLEQIGLTVLSEGGSVEAALDLNSLTLANPVTRKFLHRVVFMVVGERLIPIEPPEVVGLPPVMLSQVARAGDLESLIGDSFNEHIFHMQRRSRELTALGLEPQVDPISLELYSEIVEGDLTLVIAADRRGNFRVVRAVRDDSELSVSSGHTFELSEFREKGALMGYLVALFGEAPGAGAAPSAAAAPVAKLVRYEEVVRAFGSAALVPPRSGLELLAELTVDGRSYRFAAARVSGRTFRGLLASAQGKLWAERFELDDFPGIPTLVANLLKVPVERVRWVGARDEEV